MKRTHWLNKVLRVLFGLELRRAVGHQTFDSVLDMEYRAPKAD